MLFPGTDPKICKKGPGRTTIIFFSDFYLPHTFDICKPINSLPPSASALPTHPESAPSLGPGWLFGPCSAGLHTSRQAAALAPPSVGPTPPLCRLRERIWVG